MILICMKRQEQHLDEDTDKAVRHENYAHARFLGEFIGLKCKKSNSQVRTDWNPHFSINSPGSLLVQRTSCIACNQRAKGKSAIHAAIIPVDERPWIVDKEERISAFHTRKNGDRSGITSVCRQSGERDQPQKFNKPIESFCIRCKDQTLLSGGRRVYVDDNSMWTLGNMLPL